MGSFADGKEAAKKAGWQRRPRAKAALWMHREWRTVRVLVVVWQGEDDWL